MRKIAFAFGIVVLLSSSTSVFAASVIGNCPSGTLKIKVADWSVIGGETCAGPFNTGWWSWVDHVI